MKALKYIFLISVLLSFLLTLYFNWPDLTQFLSQGCIDLMPTIYGGTEDLSFDNERLTVVIAGAVSVLSWLSGLILILTKGKNKPVQIKRWLLLLAFYIPLIIVILILQLAPKVY